MHEIKDIFSAAAKYALREKIVKQKQIAVDLGMSVSSVNDYINGRREGDEFTRSRIADRIGFDYISLMSLGRHLLATGSADGWNQPVEQNDRVEEIKNLINDYNLKKEHSDRLPHDRQHQDVTSNDFNIPDMVQATIRILESDTVYKTALASNIRAFDKAVQQEEGVDDLKGKVDILMTTMVSMKEEMAMMRKGVVSTGGEAKKRDGQANS